MYLSFSTHPTTVNCQPINDQLPVANLTSSVVFKVLKKEHFDSWSNLLFPRRLTCEIRVFHCIISYPVFRLRWRIEDRVKKLLVGFGKFDQPVV